MMKTYKISQFVGDGKGTLKVLDVVKGNPKRHIMNYYGDDGEVAFIDVTVRVLGGHRYAVNCLDGNRDVYIVEEV